MPEEQQNPSLEEIKQQCIFCQIIGGAVPSKKIYEDEHVVAVLDINPASKGHILVLTKEHYAIMPQIPEPVIEHLGKIAKALSRSALKALSAEGTTVMIQNGPAAGQKAQHFMMHIIPRMENDDLGLSLPQGQIQPDMLQKIHSAFLQGAEKMFCKSFAQNKEEEVDEVEESAKEKKKAEIKKKTHSKKSKKNSTKKKEVEGEEDSSLDDISSLLTGR